MFEEKIGKYIKDRTIFFESDSYLSNYYPSFLDGEAMTKALKLDIILPDAKTLEHGYNMAKFSYSTKNMKYIELISKCTTPRAAQLMGQGKLNTLKYYTVVNGQRVPLKNLKLTPPSLDPEWDKKKVDIMRKLVGIKFEKYKSELSEIKQLYSIVHYTTDDYFWGSGKDYTGQNILGKLIEELIPITSKYIYAFHKNEFENDKPYVRYTSIGKILYKTDSYDKVTDDYLVDYMLKNLEDDIHNYLFFNSRDLKMYARAFSYYIQGGIGLSKYPGNDRKRNLMYGLMEKFDPEIYRKEFYLIKSPGEKIPSSYNSSLVYTPREKKEYYRKGIFTTINPNPGEYDYSLIHLTKKEKIDTIFSSGKLVYNSSRQDQVSGVYFNLFAHNTPLLNLKDEFKLIESPLVDTKIRDYVYGDIGLIYSFEKIFKKYKVGLKEKENFGKGRNLSLRDYINFYPGECIVDAKEIPIDEDVSLAILFSPVEIDFIYDKGGSRFSLEDVIDLYLKNSDKWYVRKSALFKVLSILDKNDLPDIFCI